MEYQSNLIWIDLEMTGLNPEYDVILEAACVITTDNLEIVAQTPSWVVHQQPELLTGMSDWVFQQHTQSGLLDLVRSSRLSLSEVEQKLLTFIKQYCAPESSPLCGNSVYNDKIFLRRYMPQVNAYLHYRLLDVSTVKELVCRWYPQVTCNEFEKKKAHRALEDLYDSVEELRYYRKNFFK